MGKAQTDLDRVCKQLISLLFSDTIELSKPPKKFVSPKCLAIGTKDPIAMCSSSRQSYLLLACLEIIGMRCYANPLQSLNMIWRANGLGI